MPFFSFSYVSRTCSLRFSLIFLGTSAMIRRRRCGAELIAWSHTAIVTAWKSMDTHG